MKTLEMRMPLCPSQDRSNHATNLPQKHVTKHEMSVNSFVCNGAVEAEQSSEFKVQSSKSKVQSEDKEAEHSSFFILHSSFFILHSSFFILHSSFFILHSSFFILHS
ncbi:MAG: hypothetical protein FWH27_09485, partial [Planctomycetaceae bacterium]|nr:hypothetical protein [Planctomycetaceae bacterium]